MNTPSAPCGESSRHASRSDNSPFRQQITSGISGDFTSSSILFYLLTKIVLNIDPDKYEVVLHPVAFAGWIGLLVTSLNLLPIGQLDGGHIVYALFGEKHQLIAKIILPLLIVLGVVFWYGWIIWALLMVILGYRHPPVVYPDIQLDRKRKLVGWISLVIFILTFTAVPIQGM